MSLNNNKGLTLIEVLLVLAISSLVVGIAYSILFSSLNSANRTISQTQLMNEALIITQQFDNAILNVESIGNSSPIGVPLTKVELLNKKSDINNSGTVTRINYSTVFEIKNKNLEMSLYENGALIKKHTLNSSHYTVDGTTFKVVKNENTSNNKKVLNVQFIITETKTSQQYTVLKIYGLQSE